MRFGAAEREAVPPAETMLIPKTETVLAQLRDLLAPRTDSRGQERGGLYPTHLNNFLSCSLRYYFSRVIRIEEEEEVDETLGSNEFGSWLHSTLERLDQEYRMKGKPVDAETVKAVLKEEYHTQFGNRVIESGMNLIFYRIAEDLMLRFNQLQEERYNGSLEVLQTEEEWSTVLQVPTAFGIIPVRVAGKIDRVEKLTGPDGQVTIRVADYKTGKVEAKDASPKPEALLTDTKYDKARQLWLYQYLVFKRMLDQGQLRFANGWEAGPETAVLAGFYSFRNLGAGFIENQLSLGDARAYVEQTEAHLRQLIADLFDPEKPFQKTEDRAVCQWCDYKKICGR